MPLSFVVVDDTAGEDRQVDDLAGFDDVIVVEPPFNLGHQRGIVYGIRSLVGDVGADDLVVTMDADGEDRPVDLARILEPLIEGRCARGTVVLAARTKRQESVAFKVSYLVFRVVFRTLTGTTIRSGNFAAYRGSVAHRLLAHPYFDLCYSSSFISLDVPIVFVPCPRGTRYEGRSKMSRQRLVMHGLRMLMPFIDRIAIRVLACLAGMVGAVVAFLVALGVIWACTNVRIPGWLFAVSLSLVVASFLGIVCCIILFALFAQSSGISLGGLEVTDGQRARSASDRPG